MDTNAPKFKVRLGLFIAGGVTLFIVAIFFIGKQKNLFDPVFKLTTAFYNVSGLEVGCNVRFSGINVGTVDNITIINDSTVLVGMLIKKSVQKFIKADCEAAIGSAGIIGDRILIITQGSNDESVAEDGQYIESSEPVEMDAIMENVLVTAENTAIVSVLLTKIMAKINSGKGIVGRLLQDSTMAEDINQTIVSLRKSSKGLNENMKAAKSSFLLKGYFRKKADADQKVKEAAEELKQDEQKALDDKAEEETKEKQEILQETGKLKKDAQKVHDKGQK